MSTVEDKQSEKILKAIRSHQDWLSQWTKENRCFSVDWISPRGKRYTHLGYSSEVRKKELALARKILQIAKPDQVR